MIRIKALYLGGMSTKDGIHLTESCDLHHRITQPNRNAHRRHRPPLSLKKLNHKKLRGADKSLTVENNLLG